MKRCVNRAAKGPRCDNPVAKGFAYCAECGARLGGLWLQCDDKARMNSERAADVLAASKQDRAKKRR